MAALSVTISTPIRSVKMMDETEAVQAAEKSKTAKQLHEEKQKIQQLCNALQKAVDSFEQFHEELFLSHKEQIVRLSVEIAARILAKDVHERNYEIEKIVTDALQTVPVSEQVVVRLNPDDLKVWQEAVSAGIAKPPDKVKLMSDWAVGPAECIIETEAGVVEYLIEEHLKQVAAALTGSEAQTE